MCLVGRQRKKKKKTGGDRLFSLRVHQITISPKQSENKRENFCAYEKEYLVLDALLLVLPSSFFFPSSLHLLPLFTLHFFSSSFIFCFLVSSCFPFYASIFFSFFFTSFLFFFFPFFIYLLLFPLFTSLSLSLFYLFFIFYFFNN